MSKFLKLNHLKFIKNLKLKIRNLFYGVRYLAIDYGKKRVGLAVGQNGLAAPLVVYPLDSQVFIKIKKICDKELIDKIVLGVSKTLEKEIKIFGQELGKTVDLPIVLEDETLTTKDAVDKMLASSTKRKSRREKIDAVAAAEILTSYFKKAKTAESDSADEAIKRV